MKEYKSLTNKEQSERLISLGIKPETADFVLVKWECESYSIKMAGDESEDEEVVRRCWTFSRLLGMMPEEIYRGVTSHGGRLVGEELWYDRIICGTSVGYSSYTEKGEVVLINSQEKDIFTNLINIIEWLIKSEELNQEYLITLPESPEQSL